MANPVTDIIGAILGNPNALRQLGREIAEGMSGAAGYSSTTPSGGEASGKAGGRGVEGANVQELQKAIKAQQLHTKAQKQVQQDYRELSKLLKVNKNRVKEASDNIDIFSRVFTRKWDEAMEKVTSSVALEEKLRKQVATALGREKMSFEEVLELRERQKKLEAKIKNAQDKTTEAVKRNITEYKKISGALNSATNDLSSWSEGLSDKARAAGRAFFSTEAALITLGIAIKQLTTDIKIQLKFGSQMGVIRNQWEAMIMGVDPGALTEMMDGARQVQNAFGDVVEFSGLVTDEQRKYYRFIGDSTEAIRFVTESLTLLGKSGIRVSEGSMDLIGDSFAFLNKAAGVTSDQFHGMMEGLLQDEDIRERLRSAQEGERAAIVSGIAQQLKLNVAMGMTIEQAQGAAKALGRLSGESAKDRFKRAAQLQATMGAMGIEGGARAGELVRMGARIDQIPGGLDELQGYMSQIANEAVQSKRGALGAELMVDRLMSQDGMGQYLGKGSEFVTTMTGALKPQPEQLGIIIEESTRSANYLENIMLYTDIMSKFLTDSALGKTIMAAAQLVGAYVLGKAALGAAAGGVGAVAGATTGLARVAGKVGGVGAAAAGGYAIGSFLNTLPEKWGFDSLSTNLGDLVDNLSGDRYDPNSEEEATRGKEQLSIARQTLVETKRANELNALQLEAQNTNMSQTEYLSRLNRINTQSQEAALATGP